MFKDKLPTEDTFGVTFRFMRKKHSKHVKQHPLMLLAWLPWQQLGL